MRPGTTRRTSVTNGPFVGPYIYCPDPLNIHKLMCAHGFASVGLMANTSSHTGLSSPRSESLCQLDLGYLRSAPAARLSTSLTKSGSVEPRVKRAAAHGPLVPRSVEFGMTSFFSNAQGLLDNSTKVWPRATCPRAGLLLCFCFYLFTLLVLLYLRKSFEKKDMNAFRSKPWIALSFLSTYKTPYSSFCHLTPPDI
jgi:hypothetical protein